MSLVVRIPSTSSFWKVPAPYENSTAKYIPVWAAHEHFMRGFDHSWLWRFKHVPKYLSVRVSLQDVYLPKAIIRFVIWLCLIISFILSLGVWLSEFSPGLDARRHPLATFRTYR